MLCCVVVKSNGSFGIITTSGNHLRVKTLPTTIGIALTQNDSSYMLCELCFPDYVIAHRLVHCTLYTVHRAMWLHGIEERLRSGGWRGSPCPSSPRRRNQLGNVQAWGLPRKAARGGNKRAYAHHVGTWCQGESRTGGGKKKLERNGLSNPRKVLSSDVFHAHYKSKKLVLRLMCYRVLVIMLFPVANPNQTPSFYNFHLKS